MNGRVETRNTMCSHTHARAPGRTIARARALSQQPEGEKGGPRHVLRLAWPPVVCSTTALAAVSRALWSTKTATAAAESERASERVFQNRHELIGRIYLI